MGGSYYSEDVYRSRVDTSRTSSKGYFTHDSDVKTGKASGVHPKLDPSKKNKAGKNVRESFDSAEHPNSRAVVFAFDVTGSMYVVPTKFKDNLGNLMKALTSKILPDAHLMIAMIGDATSDRYPLQIGQYEAGNEIDEALSLGILEGNGGGQGYESYQNFLYYMARHSDLDCVNKRKEKGIIFISGDERIYPQVNKNEIKNLIGDNLEANIPTTEILEEVRKNNEVFWITPENTHHANDPSIVEPTKKMFGDHYLRLSNPEDVCALVVATIGKLEGYSENDIKLTLKDLGFALNSVTEVMKSLVGYNPKVTKTLTRTKTVKTQGVKRL